MTTILALLIGFFLDIMLGDPRWLPHPVTALGKLIAFLEKRFRPPLVGNKEGEVWAGTLLVSLVCVLAFFAPACVLFLAGRFSPTLAFILECFLFFQLLTAKSLKDASFKVYDRLVQGDLAGSRAAVAEIVGRDTAALGSEGVIRATVETVAENTSDGVVAPMLYFAIGDVPLAFLYKAINTMDSMLGYKNEKYLYFGRAAARLDDLANFVPARLSGALLAAASWILDLDWRGSLKIFLRDRKKHSSPNAGHPEAAVAGALGVTLGGYSSYGGKLVEKPVIGDSRRSIAVSDIIEANRLLYIAAALAAVTCILFRAALHLATGYS